MEGGQRPPSSHLRDTPSSWGPMSVRFSAIMRAASSWVLALSLGAVFLAACNRPDLVLRARDVSSARGGKAVSIQGVVVDVTTPRFDMSSLVHEDAVVTIRVIKGSVPGHPEASIIAYYYDRDPLVRAGWMDGDEVTLVFGPQGRLRSVAPNVYMPAPLP